VAITQLIVAVRTTGANQLRNLSAGFRQASRAGSLAANQLRRDFDRAVVALDRAREANRRAVASGNHHQMLLTAMAARQAARNVDDLADQLRQANRQATSLAGRMGAVAAAAFAAGSDLPGRSKFLVAGVVGAIAAAAPAIGAALQGALLAGLGGIGLGAAIFAAFKTEEVRTVWKDLFKGIGGDLKAFGKQLGPDLVASADTFRAAWARARDFVRDLFGSLSTTIGPLTAGLVGMAREAAPGIKQAFAAAVPVLIELGRMLPTLGRGIESFFDSISQSGTGALKGIRFLVLALSGSLMLLGNTIQFLSGWFDFWTEKAGAVYSALAKIPLLGKAFQPLADMFEGINKPADAATGQLKILNGTQLATAQAARQAADEVRRLSGELGNMVNDALSASQANIAWEAALDAVTESVRENGRQIDISTEKGRANATAVNSAVEAALRKRDADIALAGGEKASQQAVEAANGAFRNQIAQLEATLIKMGFTKGQVEALLGSYRNLANAPNITKFVEIQYRTTGDARAAVAAGQAVRTPGGRVGFAEGTRSAPAGWAWVGEKGPELMRFRGGEQVFTASESSRMMRAGGAAVGGGGGSTAVRVELVAAGGGGGAVAELIYSLVKSGALRLQVRSGGARVGTVAA
jgi:hypothetical protein